MSRLNAALAEFSTDCKTMLNHSGRVEWAVPALIGRLKRLISFGFVKEGWYQSLVAIVGSLEDMRVDEHAAALWHSFCVAEAEIADVTRQLNALCAEIKAMAEDDPTRERRVSEYHDIRYTAKIPVYIPRLNQDLRRFPSDEQKKQHVLRIAQEEMNKMPSILVSYCVALSALRAHIRDSKEVLSTKDRVEWLIETFPGLANHAAINALYDKMSTQDCQSLDLWRGVYTVFQVVKPLGDRPLKWGDKTERDTFDHQPSLELVLRHIDILLDCYRQMIFTPGRLLRLNVMRLEGGIECLNALYRDYLRSLVLLVKQTPGRPVAGLPPSPPSVTAKPSASAVGILKRPVASRGTSPDSVVAPVGGAGVILGGAAGTGADVSLPEPPVLRPRRGSRRAPGGGLIL